MNATHVSAYPGQLDGGLADKPLRSSASLFNASQSLDKILSYIAKGVGAARTMLVTDTGSEIVVCGASTPSTDRELPDAIAAALSLGTGLNGRPQWFQFSDDGQPAHLMMIRFPIAAQIFTFFGLFRFTSDAAQAKANSTIEILHPLLEAIADIWTTGERTTRDLRTLRVAIDNSALGIILLDDARTAIMTNAVARRLLDRQDGLRRVGKSVGGSGLADTIRLQTAVGHVIGRSGQSRPLIVALSRAAQQRPLMVAVSATAQDLETVGPTAMLQVMDPECDFTQLLEPVCKHYGLSPVESRLAVHLTIGSSLAEAAGAMRLRPATARSYLKQIFLKTDIGRQSELVGMMLRSCVPTVRSGEMMPLK